MFFELILGLATLMILLTVGLFLLKVIFTVIIIPVKILFFLTKGLLALVVGIPLLLIAAAFLATTLPLALILVILPLCLLGGLVVAIFH